MSWTVRIEVVEEDRVTKYCPLENEQSLSYNDVITYWQKNQQFRQFFTELLKESSYPAYRWETPAVTNTSVDRDFEFVLINAPGLDRTVDEKSFTSEFSKSENKNSSVLTFSNLSGDATMVVPCHVSDKSNYGHLAAFIRLADPEQVDELWQAVGIAMQKRSSDKPIWLSTAGMGVSWLHVRLDSRPKYYGHQPYKIA